MNELTTTSRTLAEVEESIERHIGAAKESFMKIGEDLKDVRDNRLYKPENGGQYGTFEDYCRERWGFSRVHGYRLIVGAEIALALPAGNNAAPTSERQLRPLATIPEAEERRHAWEEAVRTYGPQPTHDQVRAIVERRAQRMLHQEAEAIIEHGRQTYMEVTTALKKIRDRKGYAAAGHHSFEDFCRAERLDLDIVAFALELEEVSA